MNDVLKEKKIKRVCRAFVLFPNKMFNFWFKKQISTLNLRCITRKESCLDHSVLTRSIGRCFYSSQMKMCSEQVEKV